MNDMTAHREEPLRSSKRRLERPAAIILTSTALDRIAELMSKAPAGAIGVKLSTPRRGCSGLAYSVDYVTEENAFDEKIVTPGGTFYVDGASVGDITETSLKDRRILGSEGFISVHVVVDSASGKVVGGPAVSARGFLEDDSVFDEVVPLVTQAIEEAGARGVGDAHQLQQVVRRTVGRWVSGTHRRRPMIIPVVIEV